MNASQDEYRDQFYASTYATYDFRIRDEGDNGEFLTWATVDLIERGKVVATESFTCSSEDPYGPVMSAYGSGKDNEASVQARSYAWSWVELREAGGIEGALAPFGPEWQREQEERYRVAA